MTDLDLERLGYVWRQRPDPAELAELQRTAERVRRRARWTQIVDTFGALALSAAILVLVYRNPGLDTALIGGAAILYLLYGQIRQRRVQAAELKGLTGTAEEMLDQSIERVKAKLRYLRFGAVALPPGILLGGLLAYTFEGRSGGEVSARIAAHPGLGVAINTIAVIMIAATVVYLIRSYRNGRRELERLTALRNAYRGEAEEQVPVE